MNQYSMWNNTYMNQYLYNTTLTWINIYTKKHKNQYLYGAIFIWSNDPTKHINMKQQTQGSIQSNIHHKKHSPVATCRGQQSVATTGFPLTPKWTLLRPQNMSKTSKIFSVISVSNEHTSKILDQDVSIRPLFEL